MKTRIFPGATENEKAIFAFLLASLEIHGADSAEMFEGIEGMTITAGDMHSKDSVYAVYRELNARGFTLFCKSHGMREGIAEYEYGKNGRINLHMMIHF